jgi:hypothetical protein
MRAAGINVVPVIDVQVVAQKQAAIPDELGRRRQALLESQISCRR